MRPRIASRSRSWTAHYFPSPYLTDGVRLVEAQVLEARRGPRAALDFLADVLAGLPEHQSVLLTDPASAPWLVRVALAAGDREQAARIVTAIGEVARGNPRSPSSALRPSMPRGC